MGDRSYLHVSPEQVAAARLVARMNERSGLESDEATLAIAAAEPLRFDLQPDDATEVLVHWKGTSRDVPSKSLLIRDEDNDRFGIAIPEKNDDSRFEVYYLDPSQVEPVARDLEPDFIFRGIDNETIIGEVKITKRGDTGKFLPRLPDIASTYEEVDIAATIPKDSLFQDKPDTEELEYGATHYVGLVQKRPFSTEPGILMDDLHSTEYEEPTFNSLEALRASVEKSRVSRELEVKSASDETEVQDSALRRWLGRFSRHDDD